MICPSAAIADHPVAPTTAAIAPNAPIGATHMIIASTRNTTRSKCLTPRSTAWPDLPSPWIANPISSATNSVCSTISPTSGDTSVVGMMPSRNSVVVCASSVAAGPPPGVTIRPAPGCRRFPTTSPMISAKVDITTKYSSARLPTLPTFAASRIEPMPSTIVQKITGEMIILMRLTNAVPIGRSATPRAGQMRPTATPATTATITAM